MKRKLTALLILICVIALIALVFAHSKSVPSYFSVLEANWSIELPENALWSKVYEKDTGSSFHGDGIRYHVYSYENPDAVEDMLPWSQVEGKTMSWEQINGGEKRYHSFSEDICVWLADLSIPETEYPVFENCKYWYDKQDDNSQIIVVWNSTLKRLYIVEYFI